MKDGLLICTPMYGGQNTEEYFRSCLALQGELIRLGMPHDWYTLSGESRITSARDICAAVFLNETDYTRLMFIDADIGYSPEDVAKLWNLDMPLCGGFYPMKADNAPLDVWQNGEPVDISGRADPMTVDYVRTGFMMVHREVFEKIRLADPDIEYDENKIGKCWAFFQDPVMNRTRLPEDYFFCQEWRKHGEVWLDPSVRLNHVGTKVYGAPDKRSADQSAAA